MHRKTIAIVLSLLLFVAFNAAAQDNPDLSDETCLSCHSDTTLTGMDAGRKELFVFVNGSRFHLTVHGQNGCISCHSDITEVPHADQLQKVECGSCHSDEADVYMASSHGVAYQKKIPEAPD